jgi:hypothetical protein
VLVQTLEGHGCSPAHPLRPGQSHRHSSRSAPLATLPPLDTPPLLALVSLAGRGEPAPQYSDAFRRMRHFVYELAGTGHWREG